MRNSKKGVTLVELIICCAIITMLGGACTAVIASGSTVFNTSSRAASSQLDSDVLQTYMINNLPSARHPAVMAEGFDPNGMNKGTYLFFDKDSGYFTIRIDGKNTTIRTIEEFKYSIKKAGDSASESARAQFVYTIKMSDGSTMNGGFIMGNTCYNDDMAGIVDVDASKKPFRFNYSE